MSKSVVAITAAIISLQFTTPGHTNPPVDGRRTLAATMAVPSDISALFARACNDCHRNETNWRWYTYAAPVSWFTVRHVNKGRTDWNVSEWGQYHARRKETRLRAICAQVRDGTMPPRSYTLVHREARIQPHDVKVICDWTERAKRELAVTQP